MKQHAIILGRIGGRSKTKRKAMAARANGSLGGRRYYAIVEIGGPIIGMGRSVKACLEDAALNLDGGLKEAKTARLIHAVNVFVCGSLCLAPCSVELAKAIAKTGGGVAWRIDDSGKLEAK